MRLLIRLLSSLAALLLLDRVIGMTEPERADWSERDAKPTNPTTKRTARARLASTVVVVLIASVVAATATWAWSAASTSLESPAPPQDQGAAILLAEQPGVPVTFYVGLTPVSREVEYLYELTVGDSFKANRVQLTLLLSGAARYFKTYPDGSPLLLDKRTGCPTISVAGYEQAGGAETLIRCFSTRVGDGVESVPAIRDGTDVDVVVLAANRFEGKMPVIQLGIYSEKPVQATAGSRTYFSLPQFGSVYVPPSLSKDLRYAVSTVGSFYPVSPTGVLVDYRDLLITERIENVSPTPLDPGRLAWVTSQLASLHPQGSVLNTQLADRAQRQLFLAGVVIGVLGGLLPSMGALAWRSVRSLPGAGRT